MTSKKTLLRIAAFFALFTFLGHTVGVFKGPPQEQANVISVYELMGQTMVTFPVGSPKSIATLMVGSNACLSVYLLVSGLIFILLSNSKEYAGQDRRILALNSLGILGVAVISIVFLFPVPAVCTALSGIAGLMALKKS